jgi:superfamily II DNA or RNA helicase
VVAPTELVASQWDEQLRREFAGSGRRVHLAGAGETDWKERLVDWVSQPRSERVIVAVAPTASQDLFINQMRRARGLLLVGDEVHRYGAPQYSRILSIDAPQRLGLSATPERAGDPDGTALLMDYFDGIVDRYTIQDAIGDGVLCNYMYYPSVVRLDADELQEWRDLTRRIGKAMAIAGGSGAAMASPSVRALVMQRARVAKKAAAKVPAAVSLVARNFEPGQRWLVYCEDIPQMEAVQQGLLDAGVPARVYHSAMAGDKASTLSDFASNGGVVVSIRCLDEGVDIPEASHAVIIASSQNPREFIQRRGRVLRKSASKTLAYIYDVLVVPAGEGDDSTRTLVWSELARAAEFANYALNTDARIPLEEACISLGIDLADLYGVLEGAGIEVDD